MATYTLTTIGDNLVGTTGNDIFNALYDAAVTDTFAANDFLDGGAGIDTLHLDHRLDVAITPPDDLWTHVSYIEKIEINTTGNGAQTITTGINFQSAFAAAGVNLTTGTTGSGAIGLTMTTFTGVATIRTTSLAGAQTIVTGSGSTTVAAISDAGALIIKGIGLNSVFATTTGAGAQTIGDGSGNGANLAVVIASSAGGAQTIISTNTNAVIVVATSAAGEQNIVTNAGADIVMASTTSAINTIDTGEGNDTVTIFATASGNYTINAGSGNDAMTGGAGNDTLIGGLGDDILNGGAGVDNMIGGDGSDLYYVDINTDVVTETNAIASTGGIDTVYSSIAAYTLTANVENGKIISTEIANLTGNSLNNILDGNIGNNIINGGLGNDVINGGAGTDTMIGGAGSDSYYVDNVGDVVTESTGQDWDAVYSTVSYTLSANVEALVLTGSAAINATGNAGYNYLVGNSADNIFDAKAGADFMVGGAGNDSYNVDTSGDTIIEYANEGWDTAWSSSHYTLGVNVEALLFYGSANLNGYGNADYNYLVGNSGNNLLDGQGGNDLIDGGEGADTLVGSLGADNYILTEITAVTDTLRIATGDSLVTVGGYDFATGFKLGTGIVSTAGVDKLDLVNTSIATNAAAVNGVDLGAILSHSINNGIISFDDINNYTTPMTITGGYLPSVFGYLQANITGGNTVAFIAEGNTYVFQDGGVTDTLVELVGVVASSINTTGLGANAVWIV